MRIYLQELLYKFFFGSVRTSDCDLCREQFNKAYALPNGGIACKLGSRGLRISRAQARRCRGCSALSKYYD